MTIVRKVFILAVGLFVAACGASLDPIDYTAFRTSDPHSIAIVPVLNTSNEPDAADYFLTTIAFPLAEKGYYVFPTNMIKRVMEDDGLGDAGLVHGADPRRVAGLFDADTVLFVEITEWDSNYNVVSASISVGLIYRLIDGETGDTLWQASERIVHDRSSSSGNLIADLVATAVTAAIDSTRSDFTKVAHKANMETLYRLQRGIPAGPYSPEYGKDSEGFPSTGSGWIGTTPEGSQNE